MNRYTIFTLKKLICFSLILFCISTNAQKLISTSNIYNDEDGFMPNEGQLTDANNVYNDEVAFVNFGRDMNIQLRKTGFSYERFVCYGRMDTTTKPYDFMFPNKRKYIDEKIIYHRIDIEIVGMNPDYKIEQQGMSPGYMHYVLGESGHEITKNIHQYNKVLYKSIYNNIDLEFMMVNGKFKFNWVLHPGADINDIKLKYNNANGLKLAEGNLQIKTNLGILEESLPSSYIVSLSTIKSNDNNSNQVKVVYNINKNIISYECSGHKNTQTLVIDPLVVYKWGTYIAAFYDSALKIVANVDQYFGGGDCDKAGNSYFVGRSDGKCGFATKGKPWDTTTFYSGSLLVKFNPLGQRIWGVNFGKLSDTYFYRVRTDDSCNLWFCGATYASGGIATKGSYIDSLYNPVKYHIDAGFVSKYDSSGNLILGTYLSNNRYTGTYATDFTFDGNNNIVVAGYTNGDTSIGTIGTHQPKKSGSHEDAFIIKLSPTMQRIWGTYYGGNYALGMDIARGLAVDKYNNIYISGYTNNDSGITTSDCYRCKRFSYGDGDGFLAKFSPQGNLLYGSFYGSKGGDGLTRAIIDDDNNWVIVGIIDGIGMCTPGVFDTITRNGLGTPHIVVFDSLMHRKYACNIAGGGRIWDLRLKDGDYYMAGEAYAAYPGRKFTNSSSPFEKGNGWSDGFIVRISPELDSVRWGTVAGGRSAEVINQIGFSGKDIYAFGTSGSADRIGSPGTFMPNHPDTSQGVIIGFMMRFTECSPALMVKSPQNICEGDSIILTATGAQSYQWSPVNSTQASIIVKPTQNSIYTVTGTDTGICSITKTVKVNVGKKPSLSLQLLGKSSFCLGDSVGIKAHYNDSTNINWTFNSQPLYDKQDSVRYAKQAEYIV